MPITAEDEALLPPMVPYAEVEENRRLEDLKAFRSYLADAGAVRCLVDMYKHVLKHEMRLDNPEVVKKFLQDYRDKSPAAQEALQLERENATLREYNGVLEQQAQELAAQVEEQMRLRTGRAIWIGLANPAFWGEAPEALSLEQLGNRMCATQQVAQAAQPSDEEVAALSKDGVLELVTGMSEELFDWCRTELQSKLGAHEPGEPLFDVGDPGVQAFLEAAAGMLLPEGELAPR